MAKSDLSTMKEFWADWSQDLKNRRKPRTSFRVTNGSQMDRDEITAYWRRRHTAVARSRVEDEIKQSLQAGSHPSRT